MSYIDYEKAQKMGLKAFKLAVSKGENEYLPVLDEILEGVDIQNEVSLGLVQIPLSNVVGTSNVGRTYAFANNFMPILDYKTEFGAKWSSLCDSQIEEGIREPIKVFEYMNKFYVVEGNKRVSVLKYFGAVTIPAYVTRKIPVYNEDDLDVKIYYEFMDFYKLTEINYLWFSQEGCFKRLLEVVCENPEAEWTEEQKKDFGSANHNFTQALRAKGGDKLPITASDALLIFIDIYGYDEIRDLTENEMKEMIAPLWEEFLAESKGREIQLRMEPAVKGRKKIMEYFFTPSQKPVMVAFLFDKDPNESEWLYGHELGRLYLDEKYSERFKTVKVHNITTEQEAVEAMEDLINMGAKVIFTTSSQQIGASVKVAANNPSVIVMNCSLNTSYTIVRTYYTRFYEVKFLAGMIAGALSRNGQIGYLADYPIFGMPANINAFALGAKMVNPRARVFLEWTSVKGVSREKAIQNFKEKGVHYVSDQVMIKPRAASRLFGLYAIDGAEPVNLAMPLYQWGEFYAKLLDGVLNGTFQQEGENGDKAINYWWGLSAGVVDIICSNKVPEGTRRMIEVIKNLLIKNEFSPFEGAIRDRNGVLKNKAEEKMTPDEIMKMSWLVENVEGEIPEIDEIKDEAKSIVVLKGVNSEE